MAAYRRVHGFGHLRADYRGPELAPKPWARFDHRTTFAFTVSLCQLAATFEMVNGWTADHESCIAVVTTAIRLEFGFDSTAIRQLIKGHKRHSDVTR